MLGGVAAGIARRIGIDPVIVRIALVLFALSGGFGAAAYVLGWLLIPLAGEEDTIASRAINDRLGIALMASVIPLAIVLGIIAHELRRAWINTFSWAALFAIAGLVFVYRNASSPERQKMRRLTRPVTDLVTPGKRSTPLFLGRLAISIALFVAGLTALSEGRPGTGFGNVLGLLVMIAGVVILFGPWWLRLLHDLVAERQARARAEERADIAARVHDSVLQTLALIQRQADQPQQVVQLARAQERELRSWLFGGTPPGSANQMDATFGAGVTRLQNEVERDHRLPVEVVVVGECPLDDRLRTLLAAAKEATVNAAKWSGAPVVSIFAEVEASGVSVYVRDRGSGFVVEEVPADRKGIAESVTGRMARVGGTATIRSSPGAGTEVELRLPVDAGWRTPA